MDDVFIIGSSSTSIGRKSTESFRDLTRAAVVGAIEDAGGSNIGQEIGSAWFGNVLMDFWGQHSTRGHFSLVPLEEEGILANRLPIVNVEGGCATGSMALHSGVKDVRSGECALSLAIGVEKTFIPDAAPTETFQMFRAGENSFEPERTIAAYNELLRPLGRRLETGGDRSMFMDTYAAQALSYMDRFGVSEQQLAMVAAKSHNFAVDNERAQYRFPMTVDEVLKDRTVSWPLTRAMCAPIGDGAAAALVCSADFLATCPPHVRERAVRVAGTAMTSGIYRRPEAPSLSRMAADRAYERAGIGPTDVDVAELHDATCFGEIYQYEMLRFCDIGGGGAFAEAKETSLGGSIPTNTSGGLVSKGHPIGATGLSMTHEIVQQLRGEAGPRQVVGARTGLIENGGGIMGLEEAACCVTILSTA
jgi:acetyl-CoA acetyltransferase